MIRVIILKGLPASGKSTWAKEQVKNDPSRFLRVNKDDLRQMLFDSVYGGKREATVLAVRDAIIKLGIEQNKTVIVDDTNLNPIHEENIKKIAESNGAGWLVKWFETPVDVCVDRDAQRSGASKVGRDVIVGMYNKYIKPDTKHEYKAELPCAVIVDLDGTLALNTSGRSFYDESKAINDTLNVPVAITVQSLVSKYKDSKIPFELIIVSGRDEGRGRKATEQWLENNLIKPDKLYMRKAGDTRADNEIKKEIYEQSIKDKYNIVCVFDDRNSVVELWRSLGLTCFQVAHGDF